MPHTIRFDGHIVRVAFSGVVNAAEVNAYAQEIGAADASHAVVPDRLVDVREVTDFDLRYEAVAAFVRERLSRETPNSFKAAVLAITPLQYGYLRMFQTLAEDSRIRLELFADEAAALAWLSETRRA